MKTSTGFVMLWLVFTAASAAAQTSSPIPGSTPDTVSSLGQAAGPAGEREGPPPGAPALDTWGQVGLAVGLAAVAAVFLFLRGRTRAGV